MPLCIPQSREIRPDQRFCAEAPGWREASYRLVLRNALTNPLTSPGPGRRQAQASGHLAITVEEDPSGEVRLELSADRTELSLAVTGTRLDGRRLIKSGAGYAAGRQRGEGEAAEPPAKGLRGGILTLLPVPDQRPSMGSRFWP